eukprot:1799536-Pleurochrysis_carterae.AAC.1
MGKGGQIRRGLRGASLRVLLGGASSARADAGAARRDLAGAPRVGALPAQAQQAGGLHCAARARGAAGGRALDDREPGRLRRPRRRGVMAPIRNTRATLGVPADSGRAARAGGGTDHVRAVRVGTTNT